MIKTVRLGLCSSLCSSSPSAPLLDCLSCTLQSLTLQLCREDSGVRLDTVTKTNLEQLVPVTNTVKLNLNRLIKYKENSNCLIYMIDIKFLIQI